MTGNEYQKQALRTASGKCRSLANCAMGLAGEAGECADIIKNNISKPPQSWRYVEESEDNAKGLRYGLL